MNLPPVGTKMLISDGTTYEILEYVDHGHIIVRYGDKTDTSRWTVECIQVDTILTPLMEALI
jgi:hypothetical protein